MKLVQSDDDGLEATASVLLSGGVAVIPTDTVYGLAAHPGFPEAVERLYSIKGREARKPIALLVDGIDGAGRFLGCELVGKAAELGAKHWPGGLTMILPSSKGGCEGMRVPDHDWTRRLIARCGGALRVTSANLSGLKAATEAGEALKDVGLSADVVVDDGPSKVGVASTVVKIDGDDVTILRQGGVKLNC